MRIDRFYMNRWIEEPVRRDGRQSKLSYRFRPKIDDLVSSLELEGSKRWA